MRIVVIGGAGKVASLVVPQLAEVHEVTVADRQVATWWSGRFVCVDVLEHDKLPTLLEGADALVYMAMGPTVDWGSVPWSRKHFDVNVTGTYLAMQAAGRAGVTRIMHTSSGSVFSELEQHHPGDLPDAVHPYGVSKAGGELVARAAAQEFVIPVVALRLYLPKEDTEFRHLCDDDGGGLATAGSDVARAYLAALATPLEPGFHVTHISGNRGGQIPIAHAEKLLGWKPLMG